MKSAQTPIYRAIENLLLWLIPFTERLPKSLPYQALGCDLMRDVKMSLDAVTAAMQTKEPDKRLECIDALICYMTSVKTIMRMFAQSRVKGAPILSYRQEAEYLAKINAIFAQAGAWRNSTAQKLHHD